MASGVEEVRGRAKRFHSYHLLPQCQQPGLRLVVRYDISWLSNSGMVRFLFERMAWPAGSGHQEPTVELRQHDNFGDAPGWVGRNPFQESLKLNQHALDGLGVVQIHVVFTGSAPAV